MANTNVLLIDSGGIFVASVPSIPVNAGDSVSFATNDKSAAELFFSPAAAAVLSPAPSSPAAVPAGGSVSFQFTSSAPGAYCVYVGASGASAPRSFPVEVSQNLIMLVDSSGGPSFGGPHVVVDPGS